MFVPALEGKVKGPKKVAPACKVMVSPGCAASSAAWKNYSEADTTEQVSYDGTGIVKARRQEFLR